MPRQPAPFAVEPYRPGKCEYRLPAGQQCKAPAEVSASVDGRPIITVCDQHFLIVNPPRIGGPIPEGYKPTEPVARYYKEAAKEHEIDGN